VALEHRRAPIRLDAARLLHRQRASSLLILIVAQDHAASPSIRADLMGNFAYAFDPLHLKEWIYNRHRSCSARKLLPS